MQRTTVRLDDDLLRDAKRAAAESGITLTALIESALRERLARGKQVASARERIKLTTVYGQLMPGVDLNDSAGLAALLDEDPPGGPYH